MEAIPEWRRTRRNPKAVRGAVHQAKLIQAMQVGILHGKVEPDHPERNPARQEAKSGKMGSAECVSVAELRNGEILTYGSARGAGHMACIPLLDPALLSNILDCDTSRVALVYFRVRCGGAKAKASTALAQATHVA